MTTFVMAKYKQVGDLWLTHVHDTRSRKEKIFFKFNYSTPQQYTRALTSLSFLCADCGGVWFQRHGRKGVEVSHLHLHIIPGGCTDRHGGLWRGDQLVLMER